MKEYTLMIPGPTPVPAEVLRETSRCMIDHRGKEFALLITEIEELLKQVFQTDNDILMLTSSGTGGMEAAIVNTLSPGDKVLVVSTGVFGDRFIDIAQNYGLEVDVIRPPLGEAADPQSVEEKLLADREHKIKAVFLTHNETSTGVENPIKDISKTRKGHPALFIVDSISSLGAMEIKTDEWGLDIVITASQKALMAPPGLCFVSVSKNAWDACQNSRLPRYYWDFEAIRKNKQKKQTPFTPCIPIFFAVRKSIELLLDEGLENVYQRHIVLGRAMRAGIRAMGLELFPREYCVSPTITAVKLSPPLDKDLLKSLRERLREDYGVEISEGQLYLADKLFRIGHLGYVGHKEILYTLYSLEKALRSVGYPVKDSPLQLAEEIVSGI